MALEGELCQDHISTPWSFSYQMKLAWWYGLFSHRYRWWLSTSDDILLAVGMWSSVPKPSSFSVKCDSKGNTDLESEEMPLRTHFPWEANQALRQRGESLKVKLGCKKGCDAGKFRFPHTGSLHVLTVTWSRLHAQWNAYPTHVNRKGKWVLRLLLLSFKSTKTLKIRIFF